MNMRPGPLGAESAPLNASALLVPHSVYTQFLKEGFRYVGRIKLAREGGPRPEPSASAPPAPEKDKDGNWRVKAVRCTSDGDVYIGRWARRMPRHVPLPCYARHPPPHAPRHAMPHAHSPPGPRPRDEHAGAQPPTPTTSTAARGAQATHRPPARPAHLPRASAPPPATTRACQRAPRSTRPLTPPARLFPPRPNPPPHPRSMKIPARTLRLESYMPPWMNVGRGAGVLEGNSTLLDFAASLGVIPSPSALRAGAAVRGRAANKTGLLAPRLRGDKEKGKFESLLSDFFSLFQSGSAQQQQQAPAAAEQEEQQLAAASEAPDADAAADAAAGRRLLELVGSDDRTNCSRGFPYSAIGQIQVVDNTGLYICTGTLIAPNKVLTAGHCVWNIRRGAFYYNLNYAPGRFRDGGNIVNPWGVVPWKSVTVFDSFKKNPATWDVAVVTLAKPLGSLTGYMGLAAGCGRNLQLTTAGYPQDKSPGTCMAATCMQRALDCENPTNPHVCDTKQGMSGSPLWDAKHRIRLIHVAGIDGLSENRATTLTQFLVNTVTKW
jgi:V8-like Glu-specific endopeptidase